MSLVTDTGKFTSKVDLALGASIASASTPNINDATGNTVFITGTTTITGFSTADQAGIERKLIFNDAVILTHSSSLKLFGDANITTVAGDVAIFVAETTTVWRMVGFFRASGYTGGQTDSDGILNGAIIAAKIGDAAVIPSKLRAKTVTALSDANATLTNEQMLGGVLTINTTLSRTLTSANGTNLCTLLTGYQTGTSFEFTIVNDGVDDVILSGNTDVSTKGSDTVTANASGTFLAVVTGTNTLTIYRK